MVKHLYTDGKTKCYQIQNHGFLIFYLEDKEAWITSLIVEKEFRSQGFGSQMLQTCIDFCYSNQIQVLYVDDMSDHFGLPNNIYRKHGFEYLEIHSPEMKLRLQK
jgi:ribosomal protein S18 acetylase RimI-like enzyme